MARLVSVGAPAHSAAREPAAETSSRVEALVSHAGVIVSGGRSGYAASVVPARGRRRGGLTRV